MTAASAPHFPTPRPNAALMATLGVVNRWLILRGHFRVRHLDLPRADRDRLAGAVNPGTAAFLGPNHPEFGLDWMLDKELSTFVAPRMAAWASHDIIATAPAFWTRNNLVSHRGGAAAFEYSVAWALAGHGVLLHPEGMVRWTSDVVHPLFPGIADMAAEACGRIGSGRDGRPVFIVPLVWKLRYTQDVTAGMHADMDVIERELGLPSGYRASIAARFRTLQERTLMRQMTRFGFETRSIEQLGFFAAQEAFRAALIHDLESRHTVQASDSVERTLYRLERVVQTPDDRARAREAGRLGGFSRATYGAPTLTQEHVAESLKRLRADLVRRGRRNAIHNALPTPYGTRVAHVRVPEPILVDPAAAAADGEERATYVASLLDRARTAMQQTLDDINRAIAPAVDPFRHPNPFSD